MTFLRSLVGKPIELEISGQIHRLGILIDYSPEIIVLFDGTNYLYMPFGHIRNIRLALKSLPQSSEYTYQRADTILDGDDELSYRKILNESMGMLLQVYISNNQSVYGYITKVLKDYVVFQSSVYKTLFIPMFHIKWLIPYPENKAPYTLKNEVLPIAPSQFRLAGTFEEHLKSLEGKMVVFDLGTSTDKIGLLKTIQNQMAEIITADQKVLYWNIHHIKMACFPE
ncbi:hypothetical protein SAMN03159341_10763 [Paenibacillus sp. 1_12]|uniref:hypothetical protein n=1 Tax=Paenibacillus sp. 1_12 TaxID=1566278 RepID=UPI0008EF6FA6|nr:hypothetical protein [Paenibacillus sp. 1_12]SFL54202.1 hypothetical protein SAMN03159341_10763 [Paenibacillus sp. 1_12]